MKQPNNLLRKMKNLQLLFKIKLTRLARARSWSDLKQLWGLVFYNLETARQELQLMAISMLQMTVVIRLREPATMQFRGNANIDHRGVRMIDIHPLEAALGLDSFYEVVLHEICHHQYHVKEEDRRPPIIDTMYNEAGGAFFSLEGADFAAYIDDPREDEANNFVREMDRIAKDRAVSQFGNVDIRTRILVLQNIILNKENKNV
jgi:hypothetical protein